MTLPKIDTYNAQLAELTFDRGRFELQAAKARVIVEEFLAAQRSKGCRDRSGRQLTRPYPRLLCGAESFKTEVFGRWLAMFMQMHHDHNNRCCLHVKQNAAGEQ